MSKRPAGMRGLIIELGTARAMRAADARVKEGGTDLTTAGAMWILQDMRADLQAAAREARAAVDTIRKAPDYNPDPYGRTDDEIADVILARIDQARAARR